MMRRHRDPVLIQVAWVFGIFLLACTLMQVMEAWSTWWPDHGMQIWVKTVMAVVSLATATAVWFLISRTTMKRHDTELRTTIAALEAARVGVWETDLVTGASRQSTLAARCVGSDPSEEWTLAKFLDRIHPEDRTKIETSLTRSVSGPNEWSADCRVIWPDGSIHWIHLQGSAILEDGIRRLRGVVFDITQQKQVEASRFEMQRLESDNKRILDAHRLKSGFLANMSHELRTPLSSIIGFAELLQSGAVSTESSKHLEFLGHIATSGHHLLQLINDILDISKVDAGKFEFSPVPVKLSALVGEVIDILHSAVSQKHLTISCAIDEAVDDVTLDPAFLKRVLYIFLSNGIKFSHDGGHLSVRALAQVSGHFRVEVEDHGIGIAESDLPNLFDEFRQLDVVGREEGSTGLSLALTRRLIEAQGGSVGVHSVHGSGASFHFVLNRRQGFTS